MELKDLLNKLCKELPENYELTISAEKGSACVLLANNNGTPRESLLEDATIEEKCLDLLCLANEEEDRHTGDIG
jgi:hypothetical protein